jgi:hypothetical protein
MCDVSAGMVVVSVGVVVILVSVLVLVVSEPFVPDVPPPQAAKAPSANTNKSFFMFCIFFVSEFWY